MGLCLTNGIINSGMIRQEHLLIDLRLRDLMIIDGKVIEPSTQTALGKPEMEHFWHYTPDKCQLMTILQPELETATGNEWCNQEVKIQITTLDTYHDTAFDLKFLPIFLLNFQLIGVAALQDYLIESHPAWAPHVCLAPAEGPKVKNGQHMYPSPLQGTLWI